MAYLMYCKKCEGEILLSKNQGIVFENPDCIECNKQAELALKVMGRD